MYKQPNYIQKNIDSKQTKKAKGAFIENNNQSRNRTQATDLVIRGHSTSFDFQKLNLKDSKSTKNSLFNLQKHMGNAFVQRVVDVSLKSETEEDTAPPDVQQAIETSRGGGQALNNSTLTQMNQAFNADFGAVRVHTDPQADALNQSLNAKAFTTGKDVYFRQGEYNPGSSTGKQLLAHELTHVVQQNPDTLQRLGDEDTAHSGCAFEGASKVSRSIQTKLTVGRPGDVYEQEADQMAQAFPAWEQRADQSPNSDASIRRVTPEEEEEKKKEELLQTKPVVTSAPTGAIQRLGPALGLSGIGAALTSSSVSEAATMAGLILATGAAAASTGAAIMPGATGVQSVSLENGWMSNTDKNNLELIIRCKIVNAYITRFAQNNPDLFNRPEEVTEAEEEGNILFPPTVVTVRGAPPPEGIQTNAGATELVDDTIMEAVRISVQREIEETLNNNQKTADNREYIWSDSGEHTADFWGTVGAIMFTDVRGTFIRETIALNTYARQVPNLSLPLQGETLDARQFRGGTMRRSPTMETGLNDTLGINLSGSGPDTDGAANGGHGVHTYKTDWNWDDNTTQGDFGIQISRNGMPEFLRPRWNGTPED